MRNGLRQRATLTRKTPLITSKPLKRGNRPIAPKSAKQLLYEAQYELIRPKVLDRDNHRCRINQKGCTHAANHVHHRRLRSQGGDNSLENLVSVCLNCHNYIHYVDRDWAEEQGWIIPAEDAMIDE